MALTRQCELLDVNRATVYAHRVEPLPLDASELALMQLIDEEYTRHPFYGSRRMVVYLRRMNHVINRKRVQRLMGVLGLQGMAPGPNTSKPHPENKIYPYLLRGLAITRPNQVWSTDITYVRLPRGFVYLTAIIDWYSRKVLAWRISNTMETSFCVDCLEQALLNNEAPEIFNTDQGSQYTSKVFTDVLKDHGIQISMDGRGRALDNIFVERLWRNVKHEDIYLNKYSTINELMIGLTEYFDFFNTERPHQSLEYKTPHLVYETGIGGGAEIIDKYPKAEQTACSV